jgi:UDP-GlcNAc3NAcA epimerase
MKILTILGTRPQFIKSIPLSLALKKYKINEVVADTGQHYDHNMSNIFYEEFGIKKPSFVGNLSNKSLSRGERLSEMIGFSQNIILKTKPDFCLVYGDTDSSLAGSLASSMLSIPICHVESGLRSRNKSMPEEINRILIDHMSKIKFCSTYQSVKNLTNENIKSDVYHVGDIMLDTYGLVKNYIPNRKFVKIVNSGDKPILLLTVHRKENLSSLKRFNKILKYCLQFIKDYLIIFVAHPNAKKFIKKNNFKLHKIKLLENVSYKEMNFLLSKSSLVLTDSGGLQKEAFFHKVRCITLRGETEWVETISHGWNKLWTQKKYQCQPKKIHEYGNMDCAKKICKILLKYK